MKHESTEVINLIELQRRGFDVKAACKVVGSESVLLLVAPAFVDELEVYMSRMNKIIRENKFEEMQQIAHAIKGSAATLCHFELKKCLDEFEKICMQGNMAEVEEKYKVLNLVCRKIMGVG